MNGRRILGLALAALALCILLLDGRHTSASVFVEAALVFIPASQLLWGGKKDKCL